MLLETLAAIVAAIGLVLVGVAEVWQRRRAARIWIQLYQLSAQSKPEVAQAIGELMAVASGVGLAALGMLALAQIVLVNL